MTGRGTRNSEWLALRRCLGILGRLLQGAAPAAELIEAARQAAGLDAYPLRESAREKAFKHDRQRLREALGVEFHYDARANLYVLDNPGPFGVLTLSEASLQALALLSETFAGEAGKQSNIQALLDELINRLPEKDRRRLEGQALPVGLEIFQGVDPNGIPPRVWEIVRRAVREHRKLAFRYLSPTYEDRQPRYFEVAPYRLIYQWGHWYLRARNLLDSPTPEIFAPGADYLRFRLAYILNDEKLAVLPTVLPQRQPRPPRYLVHYRLLPPLSRGVISRHFDEMTVQAQSDGSVEIRGYTDDDWEAARLLLGYGEYCVVLGGTEIVRRVKNTVEGMARNYGFYIE